MMSNPGRASRWSLLGAVAMYVWGFLHSLSIPDIEDTCHTRRQHWEFVPGHRASLFPLSNPCNPSYDLVPPYVNPVFFALLTMSFAFTTIAVAQRGRRGKPRTNHPAER